ncbi:hypothetical protein ACFO3D_10585 [Virgibacillus kekensis]|uniref:Flagellin Flp1-like domain-containing protein n=1 Tax=Virgibacillus kekensis TaxID=202261 RepID=A0ABV9DIJ1_9BACI
MNYLNGLYAKMVNTLEGWKNDERGSQTLEWIGIAAVVVIVVGLVSTAFGTLKIGETVVEKFETFLENIGSGS